MQKAQVIDPGFAAASKHRSVRDRASSDQTRSLRQPLRRGAARASPIGAVRAGRRSLSRPTLVAPISVATNQAAGCEAAADWLLEELGLGPQRQVLHRVDAVHVSERGREDVATALAGPEALDDRNRVVGGWCTAARSARLARPTRPPHPRPCRSRSRGSRSRDDISQAAQRRRRGSHPAEATNRRTCATGTRAARPDAFARATRQAVAGGSRRHVPAGSDPYRARLGLGNAWTRAKAATAIAPATASLAAPDANAAPLGVS